MKQVSAHFTLSGVIDGESVQMYRIASDYDSLPVDANNVSERIECRLLLEDGATTIPQSAYWSVEVKAREEVLDTYLFTGAREQIDYALPNGPYSEFGKFGRATHLVVMAFKDEPRKTELARKAYPLNRQHPQPFPRTEPWSIGLTYHNGEYLMATSFDQVDGVLIESEQAVYMWCNPVPGNSAVQPGEDVAKNPHTTSWQKHSKWPVLMTEAFMANFAKLGSAVFSGDYMMSQHGKDAAGADTVDYRKFDASQIGKPICPFTPNILLDLLTGMAHFANGNAKFNPDGTVEIHGRFEAENNKKGRRIVLDPERCGVLLYTEGKTEPVAEFSFGSNGTLLYPTLSMENEDSATVLNPGSIYLLDNKSFFHTRIDSEFMVATPPNHMYNMPGVLYCGHFGGNGELYEEWGDGAGFVKCTPTAVGTYTVTHHAVGLKYFVSIIPVGYHAFATLQGKYEGSFSFTIADRNRGLMNLEFDLMIFGVNNWMYQ